MGIITSCSSQLAIRTQHLEAYPVSSPEASSVPHANSLQNLAGVNHISAVPSLSTFLSPSPLCGLLGNRRDPSSTPLGEPSSHPGWLLGPREAPAHAPGPMVSRPLTRGCPISPPPLTHHEAAPSPHHLSPTMRLPHSPPPLTHHEAAPSPHRLSPTMRLPHQSADGG